MSLKDSTYVRITDLKEMSADYAFLIFGAGANGKKLLEKATGIIKIIGYIDNNRNGGYVENYPIIGVNDIAKFKKDNTKIIISTGKYAEEIALQLFEYQLYPEADFYVWDEDFYYHCDKATQDIIEHNKRVWGEPGKKSKQNQIIIPYAGVHDVSSVALAYCSHYLADKFGADIYCFSRIWKGEVNPTIWKVHQSFHVKAIIDPILSEEREEEAAKIAESIWSNISSWEDWNKISIFGIRFGTTMIRDYMRFYMPSLNYKDIQMKEWFVDVIRRIVFWYDYIACHEVKALIMWDGVHREGYLRDIAISKGIPTYAIHYTQFGKLTFDYTPARPYIHFKKFWNQLSEQEQTEGINWSKGQLEKRLQGGEEEVSYMKGNSPFALAKTKPVLRDSNKIKILICPHSIEDDCFYCGEQLFDNNILSWLCHLGDLSEKTLEYEWYIKPHPISSERDIKIIDMLVEKYPRIEVIRENVSPIQLREEGITVALTIAGTIGHEYPMLGIPVINAGRNPHMAFDFDYNPKTKEEYDVLLLNLKHLNKEIDIEEIYQFYCIHYYYYAWSWKIAPSCFFKDSTLHKTFLGSDTSRYRLFLEEWSEERHNQMKKNVIELFEWLDNWKEDMFYRLGG